MKAMQKGFEPYAIKQKKGELPRLKCFHNGIILIVICFKMCMQL